MNKQEIANKFLDTGKNLFVHFNPRECTGIPAQFRNSDSVSFLYGYNTPIPIPDLYVNYDGIHGTLAFGKERLQTFVPWAAIQAMVDDSGIGYVWDHSLFAKKATRNGLRLIQGGKSKTRTSPPSGPTAA